MTDNPNTTTTTSDLEKQPGLPFTYDILRMFHLRGISPDDTRFMASVTIDDDGYATYEEFALTPSSGYVRIPSCCVTVEAFELLPPRVHCLPPRPTVLLYDHNPKER